MIIAAADGSSLSNPGPAGWAWYIDDARWAAGGWPRGTNNMGELMAVLSLLQATENAGEELTILCDSQYVINALTKWLPGWKRKGWRKADGSPVLNVELIKDLDLALVGRDITFEWVKGHAGHALNEAADARARAAATSYRDGRPVDQGPGFAPGRPVATPAGSAGDAPERPATLLDETAGDGHAVVGLQRELLDARTRRDLDRLDRLLHPKLCVVDESGRVWGKGRTLARAQTDSPPQGELEVEDLDEVAPWVALLRWRERTSGAVSSVSSVWVKHADGWRLRHQQHTPIR